MMLDCSCGLSPCLGSKVGQAAKCSTEEVLAALCTVGAGGGCWLGLYCCALLQRRFAVRELRC